MCVGECISPSVCPLSAWRPLRKRAWACYWRLGAGNHFNEWAGFDCKWERYPSPEQQASFLRAYLRCANGAEPTQEDVRTRAVLRRCKRHTWRAQALGSGPLHERSPSFAVTRTSDCCACCAQVDRARVEANAFALASHLFWGVWALLQAHYSAVDFDYAGYSTLRWNEYRRRRGEVQRMVDAALL